MVRLDELTPDDWKLRPPSKYISILKQPAKFKAAPTPIWYSILCHIGNEDGVSQRMEMHHPVVDEPCADQPESRNRGVWFSDSHTVWM